MRNTLVLLVLTCFPALAQKTLVYKDAVYEENIKTVLLYPPSNAPRSNLLPAVAPLSSQNLILEFDDIQESKYNYYVKIIHCNADWTKSNLSDLDYMSVYNEFNVNDYAYSSNTWLPYVHYRFPVPPVKLPGNYLLIAYRDGDKNDLILSSRFMIFSNKVTLAPNQDLMGNSAVSGGNQLINFTVDYGTLDVFNAMDNFRVVIRQNQRWDIARMNVKPSFIREDINQLEYRFFDSDKQWSAGNEFRWVDFRSLISPGQNTARINKTVKPNELYVRVDQSREGMAYAQYRDLDGNFVIESLDQPEPWISGQYIFVNFTLQTKELPGSKVYVVGNYNHYDRNAENLMKYNKSSGAYEASVILKQGWYDYQYYVDSPTLPVTQLEGSHYQTENLYEVFIYYKSLQPMADMLYGYYSLPYR